MDRGRKTRELVMLGSLTGILLACQMALAFLPNIEIVSLLILIYTLVLKRKVFSVIYAFAFLEGMLYGFGIWTIMYFYVWTILALVVRALRKNKSVILWACVSGGFGLGFGALCSIPYFFAGGPGAGFSYWINGIPFDLLHCMGNFFVTLVLFHPIYYVLRMLAARIQETP